MAAAFVLAACGEVEEPSSAPTPADSAAAETTGNEPTGPVLAAWFDCLRQNDAITIAAHRGGPAPGYPENAIETMQFNFDQGIDVFEVDVAESQDGILFLLHDRSLGRTTTGSGQLVERDWDEIRGLRLKDNGGAVTAFSPPKLTDALLWAKTAGAILELDRKSSTSFRNIIAAVRAAGAENHVVLISYNDNEVAEIARLAPDLVLTASARGPRDLDALEALGVNLDNLVAWTGTRSPDLVAWDRLNRAGIEPGFGTLGRPGQRLDDTYAADGDLGEFVELAQNGLRLLSTDIPLDVAAVLEGDDRGKIACKRP
ncbi:MAG: glycerophosphodiester phosphodiesterase family protein [Pseudomonadota bacterium]